jgi:hypothetical protein
MRKIGQIKGEIYSLPLRQIPLNSPLQRGIIYGQVPKEVRIRTCFYATS